MSSDSSLSGTEEDQLVGHIRMEARIEHQTARRYKSLYSFTSVVGVALFVMVFAWCLHYRGGFAWSSNRAKQFNLHPVLMVMGLIIFYSQSILIYRTGRSYRKLPLKLWHATVHFGAFICSVVGLVAVFDFHNYSAPPKPNLYSLHSWLGLTCVIIFSLQFVLGFVTFLAPGLSKNLRRTIMPVHVAVGTGTFILAVCTCFTGLTEKTIWTLGDDYAKLPSEGMMTNMIGILLAVYGILVLYLVNESSYKRDAFPEEELALTQTAE